jgi:hypothetical protein
MVQGACVIRCVTVRSQYVDHFSAGLRLVKIKKKKKRRSGYIYPLLLLCPTNKAGHVRDLSSGTYGGFYRYQDETGCPRGQILASTVLLVPLSLDIGFILVEGN